MNKYMRCLLWILLGPPVTFYLGLVIPLSIKMIFGSGFGLDRPPTAFEEQVDSLTTPLVYILMIGGVLYSLRKAYLILRDG